MPKLPERLAAPHIAPLTCRGFEEIPVVTTNRHPYGRVSNAVIRYSSALGHNGRSLQLAGSHGSRRGGASLACDATNLISANLIGRDALSCVFFQLCPLEVN